MEKQKKYFQGIVPPPFIFSVLVLISFTAQSVFPLPLIFHSFLIRLMIGIPLLIVSGLIASSALMIMKKNKTAIYCNRPTTHFISKGPFGFTRNPLYLSLVLIMGAICVIANDAWNLIALIILFLYLHFAVIRCEEQYLADSFGAEYSQYRNRVRRWI